MTDNDPTREPDPVDAPDEDARSLADDSFSADGARSETSFADSPSDPSSQHAGDDSPSTELVAQDDSGELAEPEPIADRPSEPSRHSRPAQPELHRQTRIGAAWVAVAVGVVVMVLLLIFILQNLTAVTVKYFGAQGTMPLGVLLLFAAAGGALIVIVLGFARILQMRILARRDRRSVKK